NFVGLAVVLAAALVVGRFSVGKTPREPEEPKTRGKEAPGKGKRAQEFIEAFNKGDARAVAGFWVPDGDYVDPVGRHIKGRAAIEKLYEKAFSARKGAKLTITVGSVRQV